jgi:CzcA family heavy metal efflux pump
MMQWIIGSSLRLRVLVVAVALLLLGTGVWQLRNTSLDVVPEFSPLSLQVKTEALGLSAAEVESLITVPMEADLLNGVPWLKSIESESLTGLSSIEMFFAPGTDIMHARQMVQERLTQAHALPNVSSPPLLLQPVSSASRIMNVGLSSKSLPLVDISVQAQWNIVPRLTGVTGVASVAIWGQRNRQVQVQVDPKRLHDNNVTLEQIVKTAGEAVWASPLTYLNSSTPGTGGFIDTPNQRLNVRHLSPITSAADFAKVPVFGTTLALGDVATVVEAHQPLIGDAILKDGAGLMLVVEKFPGYNTLEVTRGIEAALDELRPGLTGIDIDTTIYRPASFVERATNNLSTATLVAGILLIVAFAALLGSWRAALVGVVATAVSLLAAAVVLHLRGVHFNMMVLAGLLLAIGVIVDDAVIGTQNVLRRLRQPERGGDRSATNTLIRSSLEVRGPMLYATLIILIAVVPILFMQGLSAAFFRPLIWSYIAAVLTSLAVALTVTPALCMLLLARPSAGEPGGSALMRGLQRAYGRIAQPAVTSIVPAGVLVAAGVLMAVLVWSQREGSLIPAFRETDVLVEWQGTSGMSLQEMSRVTSALMRDLRAIPGVQNAAAHIGRALLSHDVADVNSAEVWVRIDPKADYEDTLAAMQEVANAYPGVTGQVETFLSKRMRESLTGEAEAITVRLYGHDLSVLQAKAGDIQALLSKIDGVKDPKVEQQAEQSAIEIEVDLERARQHNLKPGDVRRAASTLLSGITVGALFQDQKVFDVVVWGRPEVRDNVHEIPNLLIDTESGDQVRLGDVARVRTAPTNSIIRRQGVSRRLDVEAEVSGRPLGVVTQEVARRIKDIALPFEYHAQVLGEHIERKDSLSSLYSYLAAAAIMIFLLLQAVLGSWRLAALSVAGVPVALLGSLVATTIASDAFSLGALLGFVTVLGLAVRNGIMLVKHFQYLEHHEGEHPTLMVMRGVQERFAPIVTTAITVALGVLPFVALGHVAGLEIVHPAAVSMLGGVITSAVLSLFVVPAVCLRFGVRPETEALALQPETA